jgi:DNA-directed RNA polymerase subunit RPC12/RpoP
MVFPEFCDRCAKEMFIEMEDETQTLWRCERCGDHTRVMKKRVV